MENYADMMFQGMVGELQSKDGSRDKFKAFYKHRTQETLTEADIAFLSQASSFYMASVTVDGWPYIQHRGGRIGFVRHLGGTTIGIADYHGNGQYISMGNLANDDRVSLFFMDYLNHRRLKIQGRAKLVDANDADPEILARLDTQGGVTERVLTIDIIAMDWNCPKYIPTLYSEQAIKSVVGPQMAALQSENEKLRAELAALKG